MQYRNWVCARENVSLSQQSCVFTRPRSCRRVTNIVRFALFILLYFCFVNISDHFHGLKVINCQLLSKRNSNDKQTRKKERKRNKRTRNSVFCAGYLSWLSKSIECKRKCLANIWHIPSQSILPSISKSCWMHLSFRRHKELAAHSKEIELSLLLIAIDKCWTLSKHCVGASGSYLSRTLLADICMLKFMSALIGKLDEWAATAVARLEPQTDWNRYGLHGNVAHNKPHHISYGGGDGLPASGYDIQRPINNITLNQFICGMEFLLNFYWYHQDW